MAKIAIKALAVAALVCLVFDLAASAPSSSDEHQQHQQSIGEYEPGNVDKETVETPTSPAPGTVKDKLKGFFSSVKEGAADAYGSVSDSVSGAAHKLDEKRKEAVAGTKKLVNGVVDKIKQKYDSFKSDDNSEEEVPAHVQQQAAEVAEGAKSAVKNAM